MNGTRLIPPYSPSFQLSLLEHHPALSHSASPRSFYIILMLDHLLDSPLTLEVAFNAMKSTTYGDPPKDTHGRNYREHALKPKSIVFGHLGSRDRPRSSRHAIKLGQKAYIEYVISKSQPPLPYVLQDRLCGGCRLIDFCELFLKGLKVISQWTPLPISVSLNSVHPNLEARRI